jgi:hypothetical protein
VVAAGTSLARAIKRSYLEFIGEAPGAMACTSGPLFFCDGIFGSNIDAQLFAMRLYGSDIRYLIWVNPGDKELTGAGSEQ